MAALTQPTEFTRRGSRNQPTLNGATCPTSRLLHLQYTDWPRMKSKQRWYQCWERIDHPGKRPIQIYRRISSDGRLSPEKSMRSGGNGSRLRRLGINLPPPTSVGPFWWDEEVLDWLIDRGPREFAKVDVPGDYIGAASPRGSGNRSPRTALLPTPRRRLRSSRSWLAGAGPARFRHVPVDSLVPACSYSSGVVIIRRTRRSRGVRVD